MVAILASLSLCLFVFITRGIAGGGWTAFDRAVIRASHRLDTPFLDVSMEAFTRAGEIPVLSAVVLIAAAWAWRARALDAAAAMLSAGLLTALLTTQLQAHFARERPSLRGRIAPIQNYGFPSGHAVASVAIYGTLALVLARQRPAWRRSLAVIAPLFAFLIGFSRIYLGVHWPSDVIAGWSVGTIIFIVSLAILGRPR